MLSPKRLKFCISFICKLCYHIYMITFLCILTLHHQDRTLHPTSQIHIAWCVEHGKRSLCDFVYELVLPWLHATSFPYVNEFFFSWIIIVLIVIILKFLVNSNSVFQTAPYQQETTFINCITSSRLRAQLMTPWEAVDLEQYGRRTHSWLLKR